MSKWCLGTVQFGTNYGVANNQGQVQYFDVLNIVQHAIENGIEYFDTAQAYGNSETILGRVFSELGVNRQIKCITKLLPDFQFDTNNTLRANIQGSLQRLNQSSLWGLMLHRVSDYLKNKLFISAIEGLKQVGLIQNFGVSTDQPEDALHYIQQPYIDIIQVPFNVLDRRLIDNGFFEQATRLGKTVFVRSLYLQGLITLNQEQLSNKNMMWAWPYLETLQNYIVTDIKPFVFNALNNIMPDAIGVFGVDSKTQLDENLSFSNMKIPKEIYQNWWHDLASHPERLLNPAKW
jgi:uncharacterized protein